MRFSYKKLALGVGVVVLAVLVWFVASGEYQKYFFKPTGSNLPTGTSKEEVEQFSDIETIAYGLSIPWTIAELPGGDLLFTERTGSLKRLGIQNQTFEIDGVEHIGEGGLLGLALHPSFSESGHIYLYLTTKTGDSLTNRIERYVYKDDKLSDKQVIIEDIPGANFHDGGYIAFGPDSKLYITTGDAGNEQSAQDTEVLSGKILRLNDDGSIPGDNPFDNAVYSFGHRNPQGLAWDDRGRLWATEHGPSGLDSGNDELNLIKKGANYGWPIIKGQQEREGMLKPIVESGPDETWAPGGVAFYDGALYFAGLRGESLYQAKINNDNSVDLKVHFAGDFGRLRGVFLNSKNLLLISTSNTDGRGSPADEDDRIIRINPAVL
ncbi:MAG: PQQ-dependent sugar dehydrogenase [Candidatus Saccharimonadales bacterium]